MRGRTSGSVVKGRVLGKMYSVKTAEFEGLIVDMSMSWGRGHQPTKGCQRDRTNRLSERLESSRADARIVVL
jgi:hypothetical protein